MPGNNNEPQYMLLTTYSAVYVDMFKMSQLFLLQTQVTEVNIMLAYLTVLPVQNMCFFAILFWPSI